MTFISISLIGMSVLLVWGLLNISSGWYFYRKTELQKKYFWLMSAGWGVVNVILAAATILTINLKNITVASPDYAASQIGILKFNVFLDLIYILVGAVLAKAGKDGAQKRGFGWAIMLQGVFLLVFDCSLVYLLSAAR